MHSQNNRGACSGGNDNRISMIAYTTVELIVDSRNVGYKILFSWLIIYTASSEMTRRSSGTFVVNILCYSNEDNLRVKELVLWKSRWSRVDHHRSGTSCKSEKQRRKSQFTKTWDLLSDFNKFEAVNSHHEQRFESECFCENWLSPNSNVLTKLEKWIEAKNKLKILGGKNAILEKEMY